MITKSKRDNLQRMRAPCWEIRRSRIKRDRLPPKQGYKRIGSTDLHYCENPVLDFISGTHSVTVAIGMGPNHGCISALSDATDGARCWPMTRLMDFGSFPHSRNLPFARSSVSILLSRLSLLPLLIKVTERREDIFVLCGACELQTRFWFSIFIKFRATQLPRDQLL